MATQKVTTKTKTATKTAQATPAAPALTPKQDRQRIRYALRFTREYVQLTRRHQRVMDVLIVMLDKGVEMDKAQQVADMLRRVWDKADGPQADASNAGLVR